MCWGSSLSAWDPGRASRRAESPSQVLVTVELPESFVASSDVLWLCVLFLFSFLMFFFPDLFCSYSSWDHWSMLKSPQTILASSQPRFLRRRIVTRSVWVWRLLQGIQEFKTDHITSIFINMFLHRQRRYFGSKKLWLFMKQKKGLKCQLKDVESLADPGFLRCKSMHCILAQTHLQIAHWLQDPSEHMFVGDRVWLRAGCWSLHLWLFWLVKDSGAWYTRRRETAWNSLNCAPTGWQDCHHLILVWDFIR